MTELNKPPGTIPPEHGLYIRNQKLCVLASFTSVAKAISGSSVKIGRDLAQGRLAEVDDITIRYHGAKKEVSARFGFIPFLKAHLQARTFSEFALEGQNQVRALLFDLQLPTEDDLGAIRDIADVFDKVDVSFRRLGSREELVNLLKDPANQVCLATPGHIAHVGLSPDEQVISLSDPRDGEEFSAQCLSFLDQIRHADLYNAIICTKRND